MSFTYDWTNYPQLAQLRLMVGDTDSTMPVFQDAEIQGALTATSSASIIVALSGYNPAVPQTFSFGRAAAMLLQGLAASKAAIIVNRALDINATPSAAAAALQKLAQSYIDQENTAGYFAVAEMGDGAFWMRERLWKMLYREQA